MVLEQTRRGRAVRVSARTPRDDLVGRVLRSPAAPAGGGRHSDERLLYLLLQPLHRHMVQMRGTEKYIGMPCCQSKSVPGTKDTWTSRTTALSAAMRRVRHRLRTTACLCTRFLLISTAVGSKGTASCAAMAFDAAATRRKCRASCVSCVGGEGSHGGPSRCGGSKDSLPLLCGRIEYKCNLNSSHRCIALGGRCIATAALGGCKTAGDRRSTCTRRPAQPATPAPRPSAAADMGATKRTLRRFDAPLT